MKTSTRNRKLHDWKDETTVVPFSGIQFLDFGFNANDCPYKTMSFIERTTERSAEGDARTLLVLTGDDDLDAPILSEAQPDDEEYQINQAKALEPFIEKWTPVPMLRVRHGSGHDSQDRHDPGPTCWARIFIKELDEPDPKTGHTHWVILALDTTCETVEDMRFYQAPSLEDGERKFEFVADSDKVGWFVSWVETDDSGNTHDLQAWVDEWLLDQFEAVQKKPKRPRSDDEMPERLFEHWSRFFAFLKLLDGAIRFPTIRLVDTMSRDPISDRFRYTPIDVDLVLDVGNSNTCGILIESSPDGGSVNLTDCYTLSLRDLSDPVNRYTGTFESRIEFSDARFGDGRAARSRSFFWPSLVRVGPEAMRLTRDDLGTETVSGLSSPKRYLWDDRPMIQDWRFHNFTPSLAEPLPLVARAVQNELNEAGDNIDQLEADVKNKLRDKRDVSMIPASRPRFSRSATYGFMLAEMFLQAFVLINDPAQRETRRQSAIPRRLRTIILTLPSATPIQEQAIMRSRAEGALKQLFKVLKWHSGMALNATVPEIRVDWDEASATQAVYIFSEINQKFGGQIRRYFDLYGKKRKRVAATPTSPVNPNDPPQPSLRVACIDIGGGTTDLMVMTYHAEGSQAIVPHQDFREGFRVAGDDMLRSIISRVILSQIVTDLENAGVQNPGNIMRELFGGDVGDRDIRLSQQRRQYVLRVLAPLALECLSLMNGLPVGGSESFRVGDVLDRLDTGTLLMDDDSDYLINAVRNRGAADWKLHDVVIAVHREEVDAAIRDVMRKPLSDMCEIISYLGVDAVLLSGRPSRLPVIRDMVREHMVVRPSQLISLHEYEVGDWYPYRNVVTNRVQDPKSTAAVGAMLSLIAQNRIPNFMIYTNLLHMSSTARYIGQLDNNGAISDPNILFQDVSDGPGSATEAEIQLFSPTFIGFRQLPHERWTTTVIYRVDFANEQAARRPKPFRVVLERREFDTDPESTDEALRAEALKEGLVVAEVEDGAGDTCKTSDVMLKFQTLGMERDYWLDSGLLKF
ncbi:virulence factor SrfB [Pacificispira sp.]|uniref:virulence factor SrfB n=1 Tax=Pacificispira sp. TaxID=2888761 RepID=UPI003BAB4915